MKNKSVYNRKMISKEKEFIKRALNGSTFLNNQKVKVPIDFEFTCVDIELNEYEIAKYACTSDLTNEIRKDLVNSGFNHVQVHKHRFDNKYLLRFFVIGTAYSFEFVGNYVKRHADFTVVNKLDFEKNKNYTKKEMIEILGRENFYNLFSYLPKAVKENDNPKLEKYKKLQQKYFDESKMYGKTDQYPERTRLKNTLHKIARNFSSIEDYYDNEELVKLDSELSATKDLFMSKSEYIW